MIKKYYFFPSINFMKVKKITIVLKVGIEVPLLGFRENCDWQGGGTVAHVLTSLSLTHSLTFCLLDSLLALRMHSLAHSLSRARAPPQQLFRVHGTSLSDFRVCVLIV